MRLHVCVRECVRLCVRVCGEMPLCQHKFFRFVKLVLCVYICIRAFMFVLTHARAYTHAHTHARTGDSGNSVLTRTSCFPGAAAEPSHPNLQIYVGFAYIG